MALHFECQLAQTDLAFNSGKETKDLETSWNTSRLRTLSATKEVWWKEKQHQDPAHGRRKSGISVHQDLRWRAFGEPPWQNTRLQEGWYAAAAIINSKSQVHRHLCASCEAAGTSFMLSKIYVNRCSSDIKRCFFFSSSFSCLTDLISLQKCIPLRENEMQNCFAVLSFV